MTDQKLKEYTRKEVIFYTSPHEHLKANAAVLIGAYAVRQIARTHNLLDVFLPLKFVYSICYSAAYWTSWTYFFFDFVDFCLFLFFFWCLLHLHGVYASAQVIRHNFTSLDVLRLFIKLRFIPFRDASYGVCGFMLSYLDCMRGIEHAMKCKLYDFHTFNLGQYLHLHQLQNGDINWIWPNKFLAFRLTYFVDASHWKEEPIFSPMTEKTQIKQILAVVHMMSAGELVPICSRLVWMTTCLCSSDWASRALCDSIKNVTTNAASPRMCVLDWYSDMWLG